MIGFSLIDKIVIFKDKSGMRENLKEFLVGFRHGVLCALLLAPLLFILPSDLFIIVGSYFVIVFVIGYGFYLKLEEKANKQNEHEKQ